MLQKGENGYWNRGKELTLKSINYSTLRYRVTIDGIRKWNQNVQVSIITSVAKRWNSNNKKE